MRRGAKRVVVLGPLLSAVPGWLGRGATVMDAHVITFCKEAGCYLMREHQRT